MSSTLEQSAVLALGGNVPCSSTVLLHGGISSIISSRSFAHEASSAPPTFRTQTLRVTSLPQLVEPVMPHSESLLHALCCLLVVPVERCLAKRSRTPSLNQQKRNPMKTAMVMTVGTTTPNTNTCSICVIVSSCLVVKRLVSVWRHRSDSCHRAAREL